MSNRLQQLPLRVEAHVSMHRLLLALGSQDLAIRCQADGEHIITSWPANVEPQTNEIKKAGWLEQQGTRRTGAKGFQFLEIDLTKLSISEREVLVRARELLKCASFSHQRDSAAIQNKQRADALCNTIDEWLARDFPGPLMESVAPARGADTDGNVYEVNREAFYADGPWHLGFPTTPAHAFDMPRHSALLGFEYPTKAAAFAAAEERRLAGVAETNERCYPGPIGDLVQYEPRSLLAAPRKGALKVIDGSLAPRYDGPPLSQV
jgi:hypothetical protein